MASAAEQMASNMSWGAFGKATELRQRILFTLGLLIVYRLGTFIPVPGIDGAALRSFMEDAQAGIGGILSMFTGGALSRMGIFALGIMPYISASIVIQLLSTMWEPLKAMKKEGEQGRRKINQYTRYLTVIVATAQAFGLAASLEAGGLASNPGIFFQASCIITIVGGTMFLMWLGEQITARGIGNGISLIIFAGIVAEIPGIISRLFQLGREGAIATPLLLAFIVITLATIALIVFVERAQRRLIVQYPKRQMGNRMFQGDNSHLPLKLNTAGVIPPIFATSLLLLPITVANFTASGNGPEWLTAVTALLGRGQPLYLLFFAGLIIFFAFFYTAIVFNPQETADNLKKQGGFVPGIRPGEKTGNYIDHVLTRITVVGAIYLTIVCLIPEFLLPNSGIEVAFGGTSLLIMVSVTMDTVAQVQGHLIAQQYEGLVKKSKLKGKGKRK